MFTNRGVRRVSDSDMVPIFIQQRSGQIADIQFPGNDTHQTILVEIENLAKELVVSFEDAAQKLGYELGFINPIFA